MLTTKILLACAALFAAGAVVHAEGPGPEGKPGKPAKGERGEKRSGGPEMRRPGEAPIQEMLAKLSLTEEQKQKLQPILSSHREAMKDLREDDAMSREEKMGKARELRETMQTDVAAVLTPTQRDQLVQMQREAREKARERREGRDEKPAKEGKPGRDKAEG